MKIRTTSRSSRGICPFCRADLSPEGLRRCGSCATVMHEDCFHENGGCTSMGCGERSETMPRCGGCQEMLASPAATFCVLCGYDQLRHRRLASARRQESARRLESAARSGAWLGAWGARLAWLVAGLVLALAVLAAPLGSSNLNHFLGIVLVAAGVGVAALIYHRS